MRTIPGGKDVEYCNAKVSYKGKAGSYGGKHTGVADLGKDLSKDATNVIGGTKLSNKMLGPGPAARKHA